MKVFRVIAALAAISAFAILVQTQTRPAGPAAPQVRPASGPANVAVIDSAAFSDDKTGITRVMNAMKQIETKFQPLRTEIRGMRDRLYRKLTTINYFMVGCYQLSVNKENYDRE